MQGRSRTRIEVLEMVVLDILSNLHVKSLTSFRYVCKPWSSSFRTPHFISKHYQNNLRKKTLISSSNLVISGPCNGLVCLKEDKVSLWNPSARELKILPISSVSRPPLADFTSFDCLGFGFDSQIDDYKVVRFVTNYFEHKEDVSRIPDWNHQVELYSLKSDSWKEIPAPDIYPYDGPPEFNIYIDGCYYWQASGNFDYLFLSFHMVNEKFSTLPLPEFGRYLPDTFQTWGRLGLPNRPTTAADESQSSWVSYQHSPTSMARVVTTWRFLDDDRRPTYLKSVRTAATRGVVDEQSS
ncbi:Detected protein of unknown function [Hibiscus syriacus]|uniref:F-box domain-containing protein n=1 Tax=Hibiscus syriacus TaxID=106335 RepID=A0A6A3BMT5_HIBSY|nr:Detected protein of unknown function [Hibiscus syriacus]